MEDFKIIIDGKGGINKNVCSAENNVLLSDHANYQGGKNL